MVTKAFEKQVDVLYRLRTSDESLLEGDGFQPQQRQGHSHHHRLPSWQLRKDMNTEEVDRSRWTD